MNSLAKSLFVAAALGFSAPLWAAEKLPTLTENDGCNGGGFVYKTGDIVIFPVFQRDSKTHKKIATEYPEAPRQKCMQNTETHKFYWEAIDQQVNGKLVRGPGYEGFKSAPPAGLSKKPSAEEIEKLYKSRAICKSVDGASSIGAVTDNTKGDMWLRCTKIYGENYEVVGTAWVEEKMEPTKAP